MLQGTRTPRAPDEDTLVLVISDGGACDVKLVYRRRARWNADPCTG